MTNRPPPFSLSDYIAAIIVILLAAALGLFTLYIYRAHKYGPAMVFGGFDLMLLGGVFDPINALWFLLPVTGKPLVHRPYTLEHKILRRGGFLVIVAGIVCWYEGNAWTLHAAHILQHILRP